MEWKERITPLLGDMRGEMGWCEEAMTLLKEYIRTLHRSEGERSIETGRALYIIGGVLTVGKESWRMPS